MFIGGGTPSLFSAAAIDRLLSACARACRSRPTPRSRSKPIPARSSAQKFAGFFAAGVNRLSLGVQSFDPRHPAGARPRPRRRRSAPRRRSGADDLRQRQSRPDVRAAAADASPMRGRDVAAALAFAPPHLSFYQLTLEPNTLFHRHPPPLPDDELAADIEDAVACDARAAPATCTTRRPRTRSRVANARHNLNYWRFGDYLGIGAGAHSKLSFRRSHRAADALEAAAAISRAGARAATPLQDEVEVTRDDVGFEFMLNALRLTDGVPTSLFAERTGYPLAIVAARDRRTRTRQGTARARSRGAEADAARPALPERPAGAVPAGCDAHSRCLRAPQR